MLTFVLVAAAGAGLFYGSMTPRYYPPDERYHTAYAQAIRGGVLPSIDTTLPEDADLPEEDRRRIYVANHPPLFPAVQAAVAAVAGRVGIEEAELMVGRALNVLCVMGAVVAVAGLGRAMTDSRRIGLLCAALFAALPALWSVASFGYGDGVGLLATVLAMWAGVRAWTHPRRRTWTVVSGALVLAGLSRGSALGPAIAVGALVVARGAWHHRGATSKETPAGSSTWGAASRRAAGLAAGIFGPVTLFAGWWYVRNTLMFGDPLASEVLLERYDKFPRPGGLLGAVTDLEWWRFMFTDLVGSVYAPALTSRPRFPTWAFWMIAVVVAVAAVSFLASVLWPRASRLNGLTVVGVATGALVLGVFRHIAGGGGSHPRYMLPVAAVLTVLVVVGLDRLHYAAPAAAVAVMTGASLMLLSQGRTWMAEEAEASGQTAYGPPFLRLLATALIVVGIAGALAVLRRWSSPASSDGLTGTH